MITERFKSKTLTSRNSRDALLGVDIGSSSVKMVRLRRDSGRWQIANRLTLPIDQAEPDALTDDLLAGRIGQQLHLLNQRRLTGHEECCCVLPTGLTDVRTVEVPQGSEREVNMMAAEALRDAFGEEYDRRVTRLWAHRYAPHELAMVSGLSTRTDVGEQIVADLNLAGFDCRSMLTLPFTLAKAASMSACARGPQPVGLISWQHSGATLVITKDDRPEFMRNLRDCSGRTAEQLLQDGLGVSREEAVSVLSTFGLPGPGDTSGISQAVAGMLQPQIQQLAAEVKKTFLYLRHHLPTLLPGRIVLFGGMASVPNIATAIEQASGIETRSWSLNADNSHSSDPLFALAIAASAGVMS